MNTILHTSRKAFKDKTIRMFKCKYPEEQFIENHKFRHIAGGMYIADPAFEISYLEICGILEDYSRVNLFVEKLENDENNIPVYKVLYGYAPEYRQLYMTDVIYMEVTIDEAKPLEEHLEKLQNCTEINYHDFEEYNKFLSDEEQYLEDSMFYNRPWPKQRAFQWIPPREDDDRRIALGHLIGEKIEDGIYYVHDPRPDSYGNVVFFQPFPLITDLEYDNVAKLGEVSAIVYADQGEWPGECRSLLKYIAIGKEHFGRLQEMAKQGAGVYIDEASVASVHPDYDGQRSWALGGFQRLTEHTMDYEDNDFDCYSVSEEPPVPDIPDDAVMLYEGLGFMGIRIKYKLITGTSYIEPLADYAFIQGEDLVLWHDLFEFREERIPLGLIENLIVRESRVLNCGEMIDVYHEIIRKDEQLKIILKPAVYDLYKKHPELNKYYRK